MVDALCRFTVKDSQGDETFLAAEGCGFYMVPKVPSPAYVTHAWATLLDATFDCRIQNPDPGDKEYAAIKRLEVLMRDPKTPLDMLAAITAIIRDLTHNKLWLALEIFGDDAYGYL